MRTHDVRYKVLGTRVGENTDNLKGVCGHRDCNLTVPWTGDAARAGGFPTSLRRRSRNPTRRDISFLRFLHTLFHLISRIPDGQ